MTEQVCNKCNLTLDIKYFEWQSGRPNPRKTCNKCRNKNRTFTKEQKEKRKKYKIEYQKSGRATIVWERCVYGKAKIDFDYDSCWICKSKDRLCIDHDHNTNEVRGLLCTKCNTGLGMFTDDIDKLKRAIEYLTK